jgi:hypothetical protein
VDARDAGAGRGEPSLERSGREARRFAVAAASIAKGADLEVEDAVGRTPSGLGMASRSQRLAGSLPSPTK